MQDPRAPLAVDYHELATYMHNQRCYVWPYVLGLAPPDDLEKYHRGMLRELDAHHRGQPTEQPLAYWLNAGPDYTTIATASYVERALGTFRYGGLLQRIALDATDHAWVIEPTFDPAIPDSYVAGLYWLGQHRVAELIRDGTAPPRTRFGGVIVHYLEGDTSWHPVRCSEYQIMTFTQHAYQVTAEIADKRQHAWTAITNGEPAGQVWNTLFPHWQCACPWRAVNSVQDADQAAGVLSRCGEAPPWETRTTL